jgi:tetratricopeptide (TPR) repeat protein
MMIPEIVLVCLLSASSDFDVQFARGVQALSERNLAAAEASLLAASLQQPSDPRVWAALAQTYLELRKPVLALDAAQKAEKFGARDPVTLDNLAMFYAELGKANESDGRTPEAIEDFRRAIRLRPGEESYYFDLIQVLLRHFAFQDAARFSDLGTKRFPKSAQLALAAGVAYYGLDQPDKAVDSFLATIAIDASVEQPYVFLGRLLNRTQPEKLPLITQRFSRYQQTNPRSYLGYFLHAKALSAQSEKPEEAEGLLRKSIVLNGNFWESHYELGTLLAKRKAFEEAEKELRRSTELNPRDSTAHYRLCRVLFALGKNEEAEAEAVVQKQAAEAERAEIGRRLATVKPISIDHE